MLTLHLKPTSSSVCCWTVCLKMMLTPRAVLRYVHGRVCTMLGTVSTCTPWQHALDFKNFQWSVTQERINRVACPGCYRYKETSTVQEKCNRYSRAAPSIWSAAWSDCKPGRQRQNQQPSSRRWARSTQEHQPKNSVNNNYSTCLDPICGFRVSAQKGHPWKQKDRLDMAQMQIMSPPPPTMRHINNLRGYREKKKLH